MTIPKKLKIGGHVVTIRFTDDIEDIAQADLAKNELLIKKGAVESRIESSIFHEAGHFMNTSINHALLDSLFEQIYQFLKANNLLK